MGGPGNHPSRISGRWTPSATGSLLEDENVVHVDGNGIREGYRNRRAELILKDLDTVERKLGKLKTLWSGDRKMRAEGTITVGSGNISRGRLAVYERRGA